MRQVLIIVIVWKEIVDIELLRLPVGLVLIAAHRNVHMHRVVGQQSLKIAHHPNDLLSNQRPVKFVYLVPIIHDLELVRRGS